MPKIIKMRQKELVSYTTSRAKNCLLMAMKKELLPHSKRRATIAMLKIVCRKRIIYGEKNCLLKMKASMRNLLSKKLAIMLMLKYRQKGC